MNHNNGARDVRVLELTPVKNIVFQIKSVMLYRYDRYKLHHNV